MLGVDAREQLEHGQRPPLGVASDHRRDHVPVVIRLARMLARPLTMVRSEFFRAGRFWQALPALEQEQQLILIERDQTGSADVRMRVVGLGPDKAGRIRIHPERLRAGPGQRHVDARELHLAGRRDHHLELDLDQRQEMRPRDPHEGPGVGQQALTRLAQIGQDFRPV